MISSFEIVFLFSFWLVLHIKYCFYGYSLTIASRDFFSCLAFLFYIWLFVVEAFATTKQHQQQHEQEEEQKTKKKQHQRLANTNINCVAKTKTI